MLMDAFLESTSPNLTTLTAGQPGLSDIIDLSQDRDLAVRSMPLSVQFTTPPAAPAGATIEVTVQTSLDGQTFTPLETSGARNVADFTPAAGLFLFRGALPAGGHRYLQFSYTVSAPLTAGVVLAQLGGDWPSHRAYPRNFVA